MVLLENNIIRQLCEWGVCDKQYIEPFHPKVRDRNDISIMKCNKSGLLFTSTTKHMELSHYTEKKDISYWSAENRKNALVKSFEDDERRKNQFLHIISDKKWLDIGPGMGGILDLLRPFAKNVVAVEPQQKALELLKKEGFEVYQDISKVPTDDFDIITLFHVFEHLTEPLQTLQMAHSKLKKGGKIIIEVPHANDFLLSFLDLNAFKDFTFWSEHLVLHNRQSLSTFLDKAGFKNIVIKGFQRHPLANHLHWLKEQKPGGHINWNILRTDDLDRAYAHLLNEMNMTDTLIAIAEK